MLLSSCRFEARFTISRLERFRYFNREMIPTLATPRAPDRLSPFLAKGATRCFSRRPLRSAVWPCQTSQELFEPWTVSLPCPLLRRPHLRVLPSSIRSGLDQQTDDFGAVGCGGDMKGAQSVGPLAVGVSSCCKECGHTLWMAFESRLMKRCEPRISTRVGICSRCEKS